MSKIKDRTGNDKNNSSNALKEIIKDPNTRAEIITAIAKDITNDAEDKIVLVVFDDEKTIDLDEKTKELLSYLIAAEDPKGSKALDKNNKKYFDVSKHNQLVIYRTNNTIVGRMAGVSAGDDDSSGFDNVWIKGLIGRSTQKKRKEIDGYKGDINGGMIGVDYMINEDSIIGLSYSNLASQLKPKDTEVPETIKINSNIISLYSQYNVTNKLYLQGIVSAGRNKTKKNRVVTIAGRRFQGDGKYRNVSYNIVANVGYNIKVNNDHKLFLVPSLGLNYGIHRDSEFQERGLGINNQNIKANSYNSLVGKVGSKLMMRQEITNDLVLIPEIHGSIAQDLESKTRKVETRIGLVDDYTQVRINNKDKTTYNVGTGVLAKINNIVDVNVTYDFNARKKYQAHQGSCQIKIYF
ncbi:MAG: autotransporter outer membrane beta-barrel domain-containing protein [Rickettsiaceae bacterium]|nr:autotransporter outer membrane beta-barrel domain-containing protein [Rickettsiaceae bacterium]